MMSREIKFRAWDKKLCKMFYDVQDEHDCNTTRFDSFSQVLEYMDVQQYTGLKDKNWKEIYEGDIVRILHTDRPSKSSSDKRSVKQYMLDISRTMEVVFDGWWFSLLSAKRNKYWSKYRDTAKPWRHWQVVVIWNIHENPELLD